MSNRSRKKKKDGGGGGSHGSLARIGSKKKLSSKKSQKEMEKMQELVNQFLVEEGVEERATLPGTGVEPLEDVRSSSPPGVESTEGGSKKTLSRSNSKKKLNVPLGMGKKKDKQREKEIEKMKALVSDFLGEDEEPTPSPQPLSPKPLSPKPLSEASDGDADEGLGGGQGGGGGGAGGDGRSPTKKAALGRSNSKKILTSLLGGKKRQREKEIEKMNALVSEFLVEDEGDGAHASKGDESDERAVGFKDGDDEGSGDRSDGDVQRRSDDGTKENTMSDASAADGGEGSRREGTIDSEQSGCEMERSVAKSHGVDGAVKDEEEDQDGQKGEEQGDQGEKEQEESGESMEHAGADDSALDGATAFDASHSVVMGAIAKLSHDDEVEPGPGDRVAESDEDRSDSIDPGTPTPTPATGSGSVVVHSSAVVKTGSEDDTASGAGDEESGAAVSKGSEEDGHASASLTRTSHRSSRSASATPSADKELASKRRSSAGSMKASSDELSRRLLSSTPPAGMSQSTSDLQDLAREGPLVISRSLSEQKNERPGHRISKKKALEAEIGRMKELYTSYLQSESDDSTDEKPTRKKGRAAPTQSIILDELSESESEEEEDEDEVAAKGDDTRGTTGAPGRLAPGEQLLGVEASEDKTREMSARGVAAVMMSKHGARDSVSPNVGITPNNTPSPVLIPPDRPAPTPEQYLKQAPSPGVPDTPACTPAPGTGAYLEPGGAEGDSAGSTPSPLLVAPSSSPDVDGSATATRRSSIGVVAPALAARVGQEARGSPPDLSSVMGELIARVPVADTKRTKEEKKSSRRSLLKPVTSSKKKKELDAEIKKMRQLYAEFLDDDEADEGEFVVKEARTDASPSRSRHRRRSTESAHHDLSPSRTRASGRCPSTEDILSSSVDEDKSRKRNRSLLQRWASGKNLFGDKEKEEKEKELKEVKEGADGAIGSVEEGERAVKQLQRQLAKLRDAELSSYRRVRELMDREKELLDSLERLKERNAGWGSKRSAPQWASGDFKAEQCETFVTSEAFQLSVAFCDGWSCIVKTVTDPTKQAHIDSLKREVAILSRMPVHPNITRYLHHDTENGAPRLFIQRHTITLEEWLGELADSMMPPTQEEAAHIALEVVKGLEHLHMNNVIHRNLHPESIFLSFHEDRTRHVVIGGLSSAKMFSSNHLPRDMAGTPGFMAPEVFNAGNSDDGYTQACDVYSFGMVLYMLMTLELPFHSCNDGWEVMNATQQGVAPDMPEIMEQECPRLVALHRKCIQVDPAERPDCVTIKRELAELIMTLKQQERGQLNLVPLAQARKWRGDQNLQPISPRAAPDESSQLRVPRLNMGEMQNAARSASEVSSAKRSPLMPLTPLLVPSWTPRQEGLLVPTPPVEPPPPEAIDADAILATPMRMKRRKNPRPPSSPPPPMAD